MDSYGYDPSGKASVWTATTSKTTYSILNTGGMKAPVTENIVTTTYTPSWMTSVHKSGMKDKKS